MHGSRLSPDHRQLAWRMPMVCAALAILSGCSHRPSADEREVIARIESLGGQVKRNPHQMVVEVALGGTKVSGADLVKLPVFDELRTLSLFDSAIGDDDLGRLTGLMSIETLYLGRTRVTDAGLAHLAKLKSLKTLGLSDTRVSDQGLQWLAPLSGLRSVNVYRTQVTVTGGNQLKAVLPQIVIHY
jgi:hypothetical protein